MAMCTHVAVYDQMMSTAFTSYVAEFSIVDVWSEEPWFTPLQGVPIGLG